MSHIVQSGPNSEITSTIIDLTIWDLNSQRWWSHLAWCVRKAFSISGDFVPSSHLGGFVAL